MVPQEPQDPVMAWMFGCIVLAIVLVFVMAMWR
jgi:hypothetical protein